MPPSAMSTTSTNTSTIIQRFRALALSEGLTKKSAAYKDRRRLFIHSEVQTGFKASFGSNTSSLQSWRDICTTVGVEGATSLTSIRQCKEALKGRYVNLVDLVDARSSGKRMQQGVFLTGKALSKYIKRTGKMFPKEQAKKNPLLRQFLICLSMA